jgi:hypothetical protein
MSFRIFILTVVLAMFFAGFSVAGEVEKVQATFAVH